MESIISNPGHGIISIQFKPSSKSFHSQPIFLCLTLLLSSRRQKCCGWWWWLHSIIRYHAYKSLAFSIQTAIAVKSSTNAFDVLALLLCGNRNGRLEYFSRMVGADKYGSVFRFYLILRYFVSDLDTYWFWYWFWFWFWWSFPPLSSLRPLPSTK